MKDAMDKEQGRGNNQCRRPSIQIKDGKKARDAEAMWTNNKVAKGEVGKVGMGQVMQGLLGCDKEFGLSLMQQEAIGEFWL